MKLLLYAFRGLSHRSCIIREVFSFFSNNVQIINCQLKKMKRQTGS